MSASKKFQADLEQIKTDLSEKEADVLRAARAKTQGDLDIIDSVIAAGEAAIDDPFIQRDGDQAGRN